MNDFKYSNNVSYPPPRKDHTFTTSYVEVTQQEILLGQKIWHINITL